MFRFSRDRKALAICYGIFHIENLSCTPRHILKDELIRQIGELWTNLEVQTYSFDTLQEAESLASKLALNFYLRQSPRYQSITGFNKGEIGIWIGTIMALRKFLDSTFDVMVLFEDDILVNELGILIANSYLLSPPRKFDLFCLFTPERQYFIYGRKKHLFSFIRKHTFDRASTPTRVYQDCHSLAYAVSRRGAERILESVSKEISLRLDRHLFRRKFRAFAFKPKGPKPFLPAQIPSTINE